MTPTVTQRAGDVLQMLHEVLPFDACGVIEFFDDGSAKLVRERAIELRRGRVARIDRRRPQALCN